MFYLNNIEQLFLLVEQLDQLEVCLPYSRLLAGIPLLGVFQNFRWNSNKTSLFKHHNKKESQMSLYRGAFYNTVVLHKNATI